MARQPNAEQCGPGLTWLHPGVSVCDETDDLTDSAPGQGTGVVSGMAVTADGTDTVLSIAAGIVQVLGVRYSYAGGTVTVAAGSTTDRRDLLVARIVSGVVSPTLLQGVPWTPNTGAIPPDGNGYTFASSGDGPVKPIPVSTTDCPLTEIYVPFGMTVIASGFPSNIGIGELVSKTWPPAPKIMAATAHTPGAGPINLTNGTSTTVLAANANRLTFVVTNTSPSEVVWVSLGGTAAVGAGIPIQPNQSTPPDLEYAGAVNATCGNAFTGTGSVSVSEV